MLKLMIACRNTLKSAEWRAQAAVHRENTVCAQCSEMPELQDALIKFSVRLENLSGKLDLLSFAGFSKHEIAGIRALNAEIIKVGIDHGAIIQNIRDSRPHPLE